MFASRVSNRSRSHIFLKPEASDNLHEKGISFLIVFDAVHICFNFFRVAIKSQFPSNEHLCVTTLTTQLVQNKLKCSILQASLNSRKFLAFGLPTGFARLDKN